MGTEVTHPNNLVSHKIMFETLGEFTFLYKEYINVFSFKNPDNTKIYFTVYTMRAAV